MNNTTLKFKNVLYNILDNGDIGNGWKYVEVADKKGGFSLPKCLYYKGKSMKNLLEYSDYINHLDTGKGFINDFVKDIFRECYPGSTNPICKIKENVMMGGVVNGNDGRDGGEKDGKGGENSDKEVIDLTSDEKIDEYLQKEAEEEKDDKEATALADETTTATEEKTALGAPAAEEKTAATQPVDETTIDTKEAPASPEKDEKETSITNNSTFDKNEIVAPTKDATSKTEGNNNPDNTEKDNENNNSPDGEPSTAAEKEEKTEYNETDNSSDKTEASDSKQSTDTEGDEEEEDNNPNNTEKDNENNNSPDGEPSTAAEKEEKTETQLPEAAAAPAKTCNFDEILQTIPTLSLDNLAEILEKTVSRTEELRAKQNKN